MSRVPRHKRWQACRRRRPVARRSGVPGGLLLALLLALLLGACSSVTGVSVRPREPASGLSASSAGLCQAIAALPDRSAAQRAFTNLAHEPLHRLAADPRLNRSVSARVLEAMQRAEADFGASRDAGLLAGDLAELQASADAALEVLGEQVPACPG